MKYITYLNAAGVPDIRVFSDMEYHRSVAHEMKSRHPFELLGAGFIIGGKCTGLSNSLDLSSRGHEDTTVYQRLIKC